MANKSRFIVAESKIKSFFLEASKKVYSIEELTGILEEKRALWNLPISMNTDKFIEKLVSSAILIKKEITFSNSFLKKERYVLPDASPFQVALSLLKKSYLSHYTAVYIHGLTNQVPKTIYITSEQSKKNNIDRDLEQTAIDSAFSKPQRKSNNTTIYEGFTFLIHNGMFSNRTGVTNLNDLQITNIERTLIDITVRPNYCGGVHSVLDVYRRAIDKISINKIAAILEKLNFIYPYNQAIGFYLEKAGADVNKLTDFRNVMTHDFYLTYEMTEKEYDSRWRLYYPKGL
jgi:predicted transcriptional regulator of viral defense system